MPIIFKIKDNIGKIRLVGNQNPEATKEKLAEGAFFVDLPNSQLRGLKTEIEIQIFNGEKQVAKVKTSFVGPITFEADKN
jgi:hypothetical protein